jgi:predicted NAD/FAD-dependent oxidoreductase
MSINPLFDIAVSRRPPIPVFPDLNPRILRNPPTNLLDSPVPPEFGAVAIDVLTAGFEASLGLRRDISSAAATAELQNQAWYNLAWGLIQTALGAGLDVLSCLDFYNLSRKALLPPVVPSLDNWLIPSGLGTLVTSLARGIPIMTGTPVTKISWGGKQGVMLDTSAGTVRAQAVIVTVPLGTLTSGLFEFSPALPANYLKALEGLQMGNTDKIGLLFAPNYVFDVPQDNTFVSPYIDQREEPLVQTRAWGHKNFAIVIIGGPQVFDLEAQDELVDYALEQIVMMFGSRASKAFKKGVATSWSTDPFSFGSYSYAPPGAVPGRKQLARPLAKRIFFTGEAVSITSHSSAHGAWETGQDAARNALQPSPGVVAVRGEQDGQWGGARRGGDAGRRTISTPRASSSSTP